MAIKLCFGLTLLLLAFQGTYAGDVFLKGSYIELGIHQAGSLGSSSAPPYLADFHSTSPFALVCDYGKDGWTTGSPTFSGDFIMPGTEQEGFVVEFNALALENKGLLGRSHVTPIENLALPLTGPFICGLWKGAYNSLAAHQVTWFAKESIHFVMTVTLKNDGWTDPLEDLRYLRNLDPDQQHAVSSSYDTYNYVKYAPDSAMHASPHWPTASCVTSYTLGSGAPNPRLFLSLAALSSGSVAVPEGFDVKSSETLFRSSNRFRYESNPIFDDMAINVGLKLGTLHPGESVTFPLLFLMDEPTDATLGRAFEETQQLQILYPRGDVASSKFSVFVKTCSAEIFRVDLHSTDTGVVRLSLGSCPGVGCSPVVEECGCRVFELPLDTAVTPLDVAEYIAVAQGETAFASSVFEFTGSPLPDIRLLLDGDEIDAVLLSESKKEILGVKVVTGGTLESFLFLLHSAGNGSVVSQRPPTYSDSSPYLDPQQLLERNGSCVVQVRAEVRLSSGSLVAVTAAKLLHVSLIQVIEQTIANRTISYIPGGTVLEINAKAPNCSGWLSTAGPPTMNWNTSRPLPLTFETSESVLVYSLVANGTRSQADTTMLVVRPLSAIQSLQILKIGNTTVELTHAFPIIYAFDDSVVMMEGGKRCASCEFYSGPLDIAGYSTTVLRAIAIAEGARSEELRIDISALPTCPRVQLLPTIPVTGGVKATLHVSSDPMCRIELNGELFSSPLSIDLTETRVFEVRGSGVGRLNSAFESITVSVPVCPSPKILSEAVDGGYEVWFSISHGDCSVQYSFDGDAFLEYGDGLGKVFIGQAGAVAVRSKSRAPGFADSVVVNATVVLGKPSLTLETVSVFGGKKLRATAELGNGSDAKLLYRLYSGAWEAMTVSSSSSAIEGSLTVTAAGSRTYSVKLTGKGMITVLSSITIDMETACLPSFSVPGAAASACLSVSAEPSPVEVAVNCDVKAPTTISVEISLGKEVTTRNVAPGGKFSVAESGTYVIAAQSRSDGFATGSVQQCLHVRPARLPPVEEFGGVLLDTIKSLDGFAGGEKERAELLLSVVGGMLGEGSEDGFAISALNAVANLTTSVVDAVASAVISNVIASSAIASNGTTSGGKRLADMVADLDLPQAELQAVKSSLRRALLPFAVSSNSSVAAKGDSTLVSTEIEGVGVFKIDPFDGDVSSPGLVGVTIEAAAFNCSLITADVTTSVCISVLMGGKHSGWSNTSETLEQMVVVMPTVEDPDRQPSCQKKLDEFEGGWEEVPCVMVELADGSVAAKMVVTSFSVLNVNPSGGPKKDTDNAVEIAATVLSAFFGFLFSVAFLTGLGLGSVLVVGFVLLTRKREETYRNDWHDSVQRDRERTLMDVREDPYDAMFRKPTGPSQAEDEVIALDGVLPSEEPVVVDGVEAILPTSAEPADVAFLRRQCSALQGQLDSSLGSGEFARAMTCLLGGDDDKACAVRNLLCCPDFPSGALVALLESQAARATTRFPRLDDPDSDWFELEFSATSARSMVPANSTIQLHRFSNWEELERSKHLLLKGPTGHVGMAKGRVTPLNCYGENAIVLRWRAALRRSGQPCVLEALIPPQWRAGNSALGTSFSQWGSVYSLCQNIRHPFIVPVLHAFKAPAVLLAPFVSEELRGQSAIVPNTAFVVTPYFPRTLRSSFSEVGGDIETHQLLLWLLEATLALKHLRDAGIAHRNITAETIVLDADGTVLLSGLEYCLSTRDHGTLLHVRHVEELLVPLSGQSPKGAVSPVPGLVASLPCVAAMFEGGGTVQSVVRSLESVSLADLWEKGDIFALGHTMLSLLPNHSALPSAVLALLEDMTREGREARPSVSAVLERLYGLLFKPQRWAELRGSPGEFLLKERLNIAFGVDPGLPPLLVNECVTRQWPPEGVERQLYAGFLATTDELQLAASFD